jgi:hypothetical protein
MALRTISGIVSSQALITGSVRDALTGLPPFRLPSVTLAYPATTTRPQRPFPLAARVEPSGRFLFGGNGNTVFPRLASGEVLPLQLDVVAPGYQAATHNFTLTATQLARRSEIVEANGLRASVLLIDAPLLDVPFALIPNPVHLAGRVVEADNRDRPIANAEVRVVAPSALGPATTDADGFFALQNLPVALAVTVRVTHVAFDSLERVVLLDFRSPVNRQLFALTT